MPRTQPVKAVRDLLDTQARITIFLTCNHVVSITRVQVALMTPGAVLGLFSATEYTCPFCPDPPPEPVTREEKSARALWRDAGEP